MNARQMLREDHRKVQDLEAEEILGGSLERLGREMEEQSEAVSLL